MDLRQCTIALTRYWWIVAGATLVVVGTVGAFTLSIDPQYESKVTFFVTTPAEKNIDALAGDQFGERRVNSYVQLLQSHRLAELVRADTHLDISADDIAAKVSGAADPNTVMLTATVTDISPERALFISQSVAAQLVTLVSDLETPPQAQAPDASLEVTSAPSVNYDPVTPRPWINYTLAAFVGLVLGSCLAILREAFDTSIRSVGRLREITGAAMVAAVPNEVGASVADPPMTAVRGEALRRLRVNFQFLDIEPLPKVVLLTSPARGEGKSFTAMGFASAFVEGGGTAIIIEGSLRGPTMATALELDSSVGLSDVLASGTNVLEAVRPWGPDGRLKLLPCGAPTDKPFDPWGSTSLTRVMNELRQNFDLIIIDGPAFLSVAEATAASTHADGVVLVVRYGKTTSGDVTSLVDALSSVRANLVGSVLNMVPNGRADRWRVSVGRPGRRATRGRETHLSDTTEQRSTEGFSGADEIGINRRVPGQTGVFEELESVVR